MPFGLNLTKSVILGSPGRACTTDMGVKAMHQLVSLASKAAVRCETAYGGSGVKSSPGLRGVLYSSTFITPLPAMCMTRTGEE